MADKDPAPAGAGKGSTPTSKKPLTHEEVATMVYRRSAASRETLADQLSRTREAIICQSEIIQHLIDLLKKQAHVTTDASHTTALALYDASDEYIAITKDTLASAKALEAAAHGLSRQICEDREDRSWSRVTLAVVALPLGLWGSSSSSSSPCLPSPTRRTAGRTWFGHAPARRLLTACPARTPAMAIVSSTSTSPRRPRTRYHSSTHRSSRKPRRERAQSPTPSGAGPQTTKSEPGARLRHARPAELRQGAVERQVPV